MFTNVKYSSLVTRDLFRYVPEQDTSLQSTYSYSVVNNGAQPAYVQVQVGPDGSNYAEEFSEVVPAESTRVIVPIGFQRYTRLAYRSLHAGKPTVLDIYFQSQRLK